MSDTSRLSRTIAMQLAALLGALGHDTEISDAESGIVLAEGLGERRPLANDATILRIGERRLRVRLSAPALAGESKLTRRQAEIARLVAQGLRSADIAEKLGISVHTVRRHVERILASAQAKTRAEAVAKLGMMSLD